MQPPQTPSKAGDKVEEFIQSLSTKWNLLLPARSPNWSPSRRDPNAIEDKIRGFIQYLFYRKGPAEGALAYAISQFEDQAPYIISEWRFKPRAESDVLPSGNSATSLLRQNFLHKRDIPNPAAVQALMKALHHHLSLVGDRVKAGKEYSSPVEEIVEPDDVVRSTRAKTYRQSTLIESFKPTKGDFHASQPPSSDDYPDDVFANILGDVEMQDAAPIHYPKLMHGNGSRDVSPEELFVTPPTSPLLEKADNLKARLPLDGLRSDLDIFHKPAKPESSPFTSRKRPFPEPQIPRTIHKISKESVASSGPTPAESRSSHIDPMSRSRSFNRSYSCVSSTTAGSSTLASPATSFSRTASTATSFDAAESSDLTAALPLTRRLNIEQFSRKPTGQVQKPVVNANLNKMKADVPFPATTPGPSMERKLAQRLNENRPFGQAVADKYQGTHFRQLYEVTRVAVFCNLPLETFDASLCSEYKDYNALWLSLSTVAKAQQCVMPERSSSKAWDCLGSSLEGVALSGSLAFTEKSAGPVFKFSLNPLKTEQSYRLSREYGCDRFAVFSLPALGPENLPQYMKSYSIAARVILIKWLVNSKHRFLGRTWRAFFVKSVRPNKAGKGSRGSNKDTQFRVYFFAEEGIGFVSERPKGEVDSRNPTRQVTSVRDMLEWFMPIELNLEKPALKLFARLALGLSTTVATVVFKPAEIFRTDDAYADNPCERRLDFGRSGQKKRHVRPPKTDAEVMNDGCARISREAARSIADMLGLQLVPCAFQGRIAGAKGMWMVDTLNERPFKSPESRNFWIEITDSQLKFESPERDALYPPDGRVTFEVNDYVKKLSPSKLNFQLLPILENRGVPAKVIMDLLEADLTARESELKVAMDSGLALRLWNQQTSSYAGERVALGGIEFLGGLPVSDAEKINWFVEHGFEPKTCRALKEQIQEAFKSYCSKLESRLRVGIGYSTYAFMLADPLGILEENEIHLGFSGVFPGFEQTMLHDLDALVARLPAHLPSDIQKVRAVFKPELRTYRDVVMFSSKGSTSLASKLSGGDYDGDRAWVCWEPSIVEPFTSTSVPKDLPKPEVFGIVKEETTVEDLLQDPKDFVDNFLYHGFDFNLQNNMLGTCATYYESYCYKERKIDSRKAISLGALLGLLVDSAKAGFIFDGSKWAAYQKKTSLPQLLRKPAYKDRDNGKPTNHLIDRLVFEVAKGVKDKVMGEFAQQFQSATPRDDDLSRIRNEECDLAKSDPALATVLKHLEADLEKNFHYWQFHARTEDDDFRTGKKANNKTFRSVVEHCRDEFLKIAPTLDGPAAPISTSTSDRIGEWQRLHRQGQRSRWDLIKASVAFHRFNKGKGIWYLAGIELGEIKATAKGLGTYRPVVNEIFDAFKVDGKMVGRLMRRGDEGGDGMGDRSEEEDSEDDFGSWGWEEGF